jgi:hypothetical protein
VRRTLETLSQTGTLDQEIVGPHATIFPERAMPVRLPDVIFVPELAERLGCTPRWIEDRLRSGEFPGHKASRKWVLTADDAAEILRRTAVPAKTPVPQTNVPAGCSMTKTTARRLRTLA